VNSVKGVVFDLDGTLVDSSLDFDAMRRDMGLALDSSILEEVERMGGVRAERCRKILERHELEGARRAVLIEGVASFLQHLDFHGIRKAIVTRNSRPMAELMLSQCGLRFDWMITREDGPAKPDPWSILSICEGWMLRPDQVAMVGDFRFDIECGIAAGARTVFFTRGRDHRSLPGLEKADYALESFSQPKELLAGFGLPG